VSAPLIAVEGLVKHFPLRRGLFGRRAGEVRAVEGIDFEIARGETLALVGESGSGKTTAGRALLRLVEPTAGRAWYRPQASGEPLDLFQLGRARLRALRRELGVIFQDPYASLNPRLPVGLAIGEALAVHGLARGSERDDRVADVLRRVGLAPESAGRFPHEFSGGQRQRIGIARALVLRPKLVVCDEAVSALDVSIQAQVLNLLADLQEELALSYLFIAHDLAVVRGIAQRVAVLYLGRIVELGEVERIFGDPRHPYTQALLSAVPRPHPRRARPPLPLAGEPPSPSDPPSGCAFHPRCPLAEERCRRLRPELRPAGDAGHLAACHLVAGSG